MSWPGPLIGFEYLSVWQVAGLLLLLAIPIFWFGARSLAGHDPFRKWVAVGLRIDLLLFIVLLIGGARTEREAKDLTVIAVRDDSRSTAYVRPPGDENVEEAITSFVRTAAAGKPANDRLGIVRFDDTARVDVLPSASPRPYAAASSEPANGTDVSQGLRLALAALPTDTLGRLVLFWDGRSTAGDLDAAVSAAVAARVPIDVVPLRYTLTNELAVERVVAPSARAEGEPFSVEVIVRSQNPAPVSARLNLTDNGMPVDLDGGTPGVQSTRQVELKPGLNALRIPVPPAGGGLHRFHATLEAERAADALGFNNGGDAMTLVRGRSRVLLVYGSDARDADPLAQVLRAGNLLAAGDTLAATDVPKDPAYFQQFDAVVLVNVPRGPQGLGDEHDRSLARYVRDFGGGLIMIGGPDAFGAGGWIGSEVESVLPLECQPPAQRVMPAGALVLVIDRSGSMSGTTGGKMDKQQAANEAAVLALTALQREDFIGVVSFDSTPLWTVPLGPNIRPQISASAIRQVAPGGGTNIGPALDVAEEALRQLSPSQAATRHILLLTDGQSAGADYNALLARMRKSNITLSTVAVGSDADNTLLQQLANAGNGRFYSVGDASTLPQVFIKEALTLRRSLVREGTFVPRTADASAALLSALPEMPTLEGFVAAWPRRGVTVQTAAVAEDGSPVLAQARVGLGQSIAFTSDVGGRWGRAWASSPGFGSFWQTAVRTIARASGGDDAETRIEALGNGRARISVQINAPDAAASPVNAAATVLTPDPAAPPVQVQLRQVGSGLFQGEFDTPTAGAYLGMVRLAQGRGTQWLSAGHVADDSAELRYLTSDEQAVRMIANRTNGRVIELGDPAVPWFDRAGLDRRRVNRPLTEWLIVGAIVALLLDVAARRVAWDRQSFERAWHAVAARFGRPAPQRADDGASLAALRQARSTAVHRFEPTSKGGERQPPPTAVQEIMRPAPKSPVVPSDNPPAQPADASAKANPPAPGNASALSKLAEAKKRARDQYTRP